LSAVQAQKNVPKDDKPEITVGEAKLQIAQKFLMTD
jgi:hypothetical protein